MAVDNIRGPASYLCFFQEGHAILLGGHIQIQTEWPFRKNISEKGPNSEVENKKFRQIHIWPSLPLSVLVQSSINWGNRMMVCTRFPENIPFSSKWMRAFRALRLGVWGNLAWVLIQNLGPLHRTVRLGRSWKKKVQLWFLELLKFYT